MVEPRERLIYSSLLIGGEYYFSSYLLNALQENYMGIREAKAQYDDQRTFNQKERLMVLKSQDLETFFFHCSECFDISVHHKESSYLVKLILVA